MNYCRITARRSDAHDKMRCVRLSVCVCTSTRDFVASGLVDGFNRLVEEKVQFLISSRSRARRPSPAVGLYENCRSPPLLPSIVQLAVAANSRYTQQYSTLAVGVRTSRRSRKWGIQSSVCEALAMRAD